MATETKKELKKDVNMWKIFSLGLIVLLCVTVFIILSGVGATGIAVAPEDASDKAVTFINDNLVQPGTSATLVSNEEVAGLYNITVSYQGSDIPVFVTKDGKYMFLASPLDITENLPSQQEAQPTEIPQTATPDVELYVMSFCPYGTQAEDAMKPVVDLLGSEANIQVHYIATVQGDTLDSISSLHGPTEAVEDVRQLCIMQNYDQTTFWNYVMGLNANCVSLYNDATAYDDCWKNIASQNGIDADQMETCVNSDGVDLIATDSQLASLNQVSGSPTLIINGVRYSGSRTPEAYKQAICDAFTTAPSECSQELSGATASTSGSC